MLIKFLAKRVAILTIVVALLAFVFSSYNVLLPVGISIGAFLSIYRTRLFSTFLSVTLTSTTKAGAKSTLFYLLSQLVVFAILVVAVISDLNLFIGISLGLLLLPAFICINGITERIGITHNSWGGSI